jgi:YjbE family integral membrane protein
MSELSHLQFWLAALQIVWINLLLSGDNAVVIAMACRGLRPRERRWGITIGAGVASLLLIAFSSIVTALLALPYLRLLGAAALLWIAIGLVGQREREEADASKAGENLRRAVRTIVLADFIMSLDNAVAVAALARGRYELIGLGLAVSIPVVYGGSAIVLALIGRFPIIIWAGGALLGFVAGELFADDPVLSSWLRAAVETHVGSLLPEAVRHAQRALGLDLTDLVFGLLGAAIVIVAGLLARRHKTDAGQTTGDT